MRNNCELLHIYAILE